MGHKHIELRIEERLATRLGPKNTRSIWSQDEKDIVLSLMLTKDPPAMYTRAIKDLGVLKTSKQIRDFVAMLRGSRELPRRDHVPARPELGIIEDLSEAGPSP